MSEIRERLERLLRKSQIAGTHCADSWAQFEHQDVNLAAQLALAGLSSVAEQPQPKVKMSCPKCGCLTYAHHGPKIGCEGAGGNCGCMLTQEEAEKLAASAPVQPQPLPSQSQDVKCNHGLQFFRLNGEKIWCAKCGDNVGELSSVISEVNPPAQPGSAAQGSGTVSPGAEEQANTSASNPAERAWNVLRATLRPMVQQGSGTQDRPGKSELASIRPDSPSSFVTDVPRGKGPTCPGCGAIMIPCTNPFAGWECRSCGKTFTHPIDCACDEVQGLLPACPPAPSNDDYKHAIYDVSKSSGEPLSPQSEEKSSCGVQDHAEIFPVEGAPPSSSSSPGTCFEQKVEEPITAEEFYATMRGQLEDEHMKRKRAEAAEAEVKSLRSQLEQANATIKEISADYTKEVEALLNRAEAAESALLEARQQLKNWAEMFEQNREPVAIDQLKDEFADWWLDPDDEPLIFDEDKPRDSDLWDLWEAFKEGAKFRSHDQRVRGRESVEKGLVDALEKLAAMWCGTKGYHPCPNKIAERALTSYRQATQTQAPHSLNSGGTEQQ